MSGISSGAGAPQLGTYQCLWQLIGADMNSTADQALSKLFPFTNFSIEKILVTNASASLTTAIGGLYTAAAKGGSAIISAATVYSTLTTALIILNPPVLTVNLLSASPLYLSLTTPQGSAATADFRIMGFAFT